LNDWSIAFVGPTSVSDVLTQPIKYFLLFLTIWSTCQLKMAQNTPLSPLQCFATIMNTRIEELKSLGKFILPSFILACSNQCVHYEYNEIISGVFEHIYFKNIIDNEPNECMQAQTRRLYMVFHQSLMSTTLILVNIIRIYT
jgi:hypothetical protein